MTTTGTSMHWQALTRQRSLLVFKWVTVCVSYLTHQKYPLLHPDVPPPPADYTPPPWARGIVDSVHDGLLPSIPPPGEMVELSESGDRFGREKVS
jgi:hypothetical protein